MKEEAIKCYCGHTITCDCGPKQETLEEITKIICHTQIGRASCRERV